MSPFTIYNSTKQQNSSKHKNFFFIKQLKCNKKVNIEYVQMSKLHFNHFIFMHSQTLKFRIQVKINSQIYLKYYSLLF